jgi:hypothetical protein
MEAPIFVPRREPSNAYANENNQIAISSSSAAPTHRLTYYQTFKPSRAITSRPPAIPLTVAMSALAVATVTDPATSNQVVLIDPSIHGKAYSIANPLFLSL